MIAPGHDAGADAVLTARLSLVTDVDPRSCGQRVNWILRSAGRDNAAVAWVLSVRQMTPSTVVNGTSTAQSGGYVSPVIADRLLQFLICSIHPLLECRRSKDRRTLA